MLTQQLIKSANALVPGYGRALAAMTNLHVEKPLTLRLKSPGTLGLFAACAIRPNQTVLMASTLNCFTDLEYLGADITQSFQFNELLNGIVTKLIPLPKRA